MKINKLTKIAIFFALIWVIIAFSFIVFAFMQGKNPYGPISLLVHGTLVFYMFIAAIIVRWKFDELSFSFKEALKFSVIISAVGNFIILALGLAYLTLTWETNFPIYMESMTKLYQSMEQSGELERIGEVREDAIAKSIESLKKVKPGNIVFNDFSMKMLVSLIISFIIAVTLRKSSPEIK